MISLIQVDPQVTLFGSPNKSSKNGFPQALNFVRELTCKHQGMLAQYYCVVNELHKKLRMHVDAIKNEPNVIRQKELVKTLAQEKSNLENYINNKYHAAWSETMSLLAILYPQDSIPRFCLKAIKKHKNGDRIIDVFRDKGNTSALEPLVSENSGFSSCKKTGSSFMCNNIPQTLKDGKYVNPRISMEKALAYKMPLFFGKNAKFDKKWAECWNGYEEGVGDTEKSAYKSTLIIPMTLKGNELQKEFKQITKVAMHADSYIHGFFCMDYSAINRFKLFDVQIGYIVADWLSLYAIPRQMFTELSDTFNYEWEIPRDIKSKQIMK